MPVAGSVSARACAARLLPRPPGRKSSSEVTRPDHLRLTVGASRELNTFGFRSRCGECCPRGPVRATSCTDVLECKCSLDLLQFAERAYFGHAFSCLLAESGRRSDHRPPWARRHSPVALR